MLARLGAVGYPPRVEAAAHNVSRWLTVRAEGTGSHPAVTDATRALDYAGLEDRTARAAGWLRACGVGVGDRVALVLGNRTATLEAVFAAARLGAIAVPLNTRLAAPELAELLEDCRPHVLLSEAGSSALTDAALEACPHTPATRLRVGGEDDAWEDALAGARPIHDVEPVDPDTAMILMYTSGTTGRAKGALLPHRKTLYNALNAQLFFGITSADRVLVTLPLFHSFGLKILSLPALYAGASIQLHESFDAPAVWETVQRERITYLGGVPTMFDALLTALDAGSYDLGSIRFLFTSGAAIPVDRIGAFEERGLCLKQGFGQTETSILCCLDTDDAVRKAGSVGRPVFHSEVRIVESDDLPKPPSAWRDCAPGRPGEIVVRGPANMLGYWERPEATAETLRDGWLVTGDLGQFDADGFVTLTGRSKDMYISGGENVYPRQVEAVYEEHPDIHEVAILGVPHERWGETGRAYVALEPGAALDAEALRTWGRERLASFKVPGEFVAIDALPRNVTGKVQKFRLPDAAG